MLLQQYITHTDISYHMHEYTLADAEKGRRTGETVLDLRIGAHQDPGIRRANRGLSALWAFPSLRPPAYIHAYDKRCRYG